MKTQYVIRLNDSGLIMNELFDFVTLAELYAMRLGFSLNDYTVIPV